MSQVYTFTDEELLKQVNHVFVGVVDALRRERFITPEDQELLATQYSVIIERDTWLPPFLAKWLGIKDNQIGVRLARVIAREEKK